jgi:hypothetical protein
MAIFGALLMPLVYLATKKILSNITNIAKKCIDIGALLSASLMCFSLLHIHYSHLVRPHLLVAFMIFLSFYIYLLLIERGNLFFYILLGLVGGFTVGTLHNGFLIIFLLIIAHFLIVRKEKKRFLSLNLFLGIITFILAAVICWPHVVLNLQKTLFLDDKINLSLSGQYVTVSGFTGRGWLNVPKGLILSETSLVILLIIFTICFVALKKQIKGKYSIENFNYKASVTGALFVLISHFLVLGTYGTSEYKFAVPLIPFLSVFVGILFAQISEFLTKKKHLYLKILTIILLLFSIIQSARLVVLITKKDTRELAANWINENIDPSLMIAVSSGGPKFFPSQESLKTKLSLAGQDSLGKKDKLLLALTPEEYPKNNRNIFPLWAFDENRTKIYSFIKTKSDYFIWANQSSSPNFSPLRHLEKQIGTRLGKLVATFSPFENQTEIISGFPTQIDNPIIELWTLERMGPIIEIYKINN